MLICVCSTKMYGNLCFGERSEYPMSLSVNGTGYGLFTCLL